MGGHGRQTAWALGTETTSRPPEGPAGAQDPRWPDPAACGGLGGWHPRPGEGWRPAVVTRGLQSEQLMASRAAVKPIRSSCCRHSNHEPSHVLSRLKKLPASGLRGERCKSRDETELPTGAVAMAPCWPWSVPAAMGPSLLGADEGPRGSEDQPPTVREG